MGGTRRKLYLVAHCKSYAPLRLNADVVALLKPFRAAGTGKTKLLYDVASTSNNPLTTNPDLSSLITYQKNWRVPLRIFTARGALESLGWELLVTLSAAFFDNFHLLPLDGLFGSRYKRDTRSFRTKDSS